MDYFYVYIMRVVWNILKFYHHCYAALLPLGSVFIRTIFAKYYTVFEYFFPDNIIWLYAIYVFEHLLIHEIYLLLIIPKDSVKGTWVTDDPHSESVK